MIEEIPLYKKIHLSLLKNNLSYSFDYADEFIKNDDRLYVCIEPPIFSQIGESDTWNDFIIKYSNNIFVEYKNLKNDKIKLAISSAKCDDKPVEIEIENSTMSFDNLNNKLNDFLIKIDGSRKTNNETYIIEDNRNWTTNYYRRNKNKGLLFGPERFDPIAPDNPHEKVIGILKSLESYGLIKLLPDIITRYDLTTEGQEVMNYGSPEFRLINKLKTTKITLEQVKADDLYNRGLSECLKLGWIKIINKELQITDEFNNRDNNYHSLQQLIVNQASNDLKKLIRRKWVTTKTITIFTVEKTNAFTETITTQLTDITKEHILNGTWKSQSFKPYNFFTYGLIPNCGSIHPLKRNEEFFKSIFIMMGFTEMDTRRWVESSFWNFDVLFQPQTHPARDAADTFFLADPSTSTDNFSESKVVDKLYSKNLVEEVKRTHELGTNGSIGWMYKWSLAESNKLILRTHTTAVSSRFLRSIALEYAKNPNINLERRYFSIDRVFRNESLDATHLAEFHQIEGVVCSYNASLAQLMSIVHSFYLAIGIQKLKFKPAYNPYTEPSVEIFGYHPILNKWTEIGNSGVFRSEMLRPLGLPEGLSVLGWGLSLERPTMIQKNINDIRCLLGPKTKLSII